MQQSSIKNGYYVIYLFTIGLFLGILIVNLGYDAWIRNGSLLGPDMIARLKNSVPDGNGHVGWLTVGDVFTQYTTMQATALFLTTSCEFLFTITSN